jgi:HEPN domain-containing protein
MPSTARDFQRAAAQRLTTAEFLLQNRYNLDAMYLAGYTVECSLKALILESTSPPELPATIQRITTGSAMHRTEVLIGELRDRGIALPPAVVKRLRRSTWSTDLRYEIGRTDSGETRGFLKTAKLIFDWVEGQLS